MTVALVIFTLVLTFGVTATFGIWHATHGLDLPSTKRRIRQARRRNRADLKRALHK